MPPTCSLLVLDGKGKILIHMKGTSQQGSSRVVLQTSLSSPLHHTCFDQSIPTQHLRKSLTTPSCSTSSSAKQINKTWLYKVKNIAQVLKFITRKLFQRLGLLEEEGSCRHYTPESFVVWLTILALIWWLEKVATVRCTKQTWRMVYCSSENP